MNAGDEVRHRTCASEPFAKPTMIGRILRITPSGRGIPAHAYVHWTDFETWEKLSDLIRLNRGKGKRRDETHYEGK